jgi:hypothetical protein
MPVIPAFGRQRLDDHKFQAILGHIVRSCLNKTKLK